MSINYYNILRENYSNKLWLVRNDDSVYENIEWNDDDPKPSKETLDALSDASNDAVTARRMREVRNSLLAETDWMALSDNTLSAEWGAYRQALRDISSHANWPNLADNDWPTKPA